MAGFFTLAEARIERDKARLLVKQGINPSTQRKMEAEQHKHIRPLPAHAHE